MYTLPSCFRLLLLRTDCNYIRMNRFCFRISIPVALNLFFSILYLLRMFYKNKNDRSSFIGHCLGHGIDGCGPVFNLLDTHRYFLILL